MFQHHEGGLSERQCLDWVKKMTARPEPEVPADAEALDANGDHDADGALPVGKLRRLFAKDKDAKRGAGSKGGRRP